MIAFAPTRYPECRTILTQVDNWHPADFATGIDDNVELNRNQYFFLGIVILLLGVQVRNVSAYVLTEDATRFLAERTGASSSQATLVSLSNDFESGPKKVLHPPEWLGWCLMSIGAVFILHSLAMKKPGG